jgi:hypothetical protein
MPSESPYAPPKSSLINTTNGGMSRKGRYVVLDPDVEWPSRCFKCNKETNYKKTVKLAYVNPWLYLTILINILITVILVLIFQKRFIVELPLCEEHRLKRRNFLVFQWLMVALLLGTTVAAAMTEHVAFVVLAAVFLLIVLVSAIFGRLAFVAKHKNGNIWVRGGGKAFLNNLPDFVD